MPEVQEKPLPQPLESIRKLAESIPESEVSKAFVRWMRSQPPAEPDPPRAEPKSQSR
jgi:hypothetical protein